MDNLERKKIFRKSTKHESQLKRRGAEEFAEEFPEGPLGAPPLVSELEMHKQPNNDKKKE